MGSAEGGAAVRLAARLVSLAALAGTIVPPVLFFYGHMDLDATKQWMLVATIAWFVATPIWMDR
jgi:hypothetical protein